MPARVSTGDRDADLLWLCVCISLSLIDIASAEQTAVSHAALMNIINFDSTDNIEPAERYLLATALSTHPTEATLKHLIVCNAAICLVFLPSLSVILFQLTRYKKNKKTGYVVAVIYRGGSVAEWLACWTQTLWGPGSNRSRDAVG